LLEGRAFTSLDDTSTGRVVIIEEMLARRAWPDESALGKQLEMGSQGRFYTVVGVTEHTRIYDLREDVREQVFVPMAQRPRTAMKYAIKTAGIDPISIAGLVRNAVWEIDDAVPVTDLRPMTEIVADAMAPTRFAMILMSGFGVLALTLASIGIYGVISYSVDNRKREFGVRIALGEDPGGLLRDVLLGSARIVGFSLVLGAGVSLVLSRFVEGLLFGVGATDPSTFATFAGVLFMAAMLASYLPARRAMGTDPIEVLRSE
jgi:putative ABC transport system permease protein